MYMIYTNEELTAPFNEGALKERVLEERDVWHLTTLLDAECYDEWAHDVEGRGGFWKTLRFAYDADLSGEDRRFTVTVSSDYFENRVVLRMVLGAEAKVDFEGWMDFGMLEMVQDTFRHWTSVLDPSHEEAGDEGYS